MLLAFSVMISLNIQSINYDTPIVKAEFCEDKFLLMKIDNAIGISEARAIVRNIKLYESEEGYEPTPSMNT